MATNEFMNTEGVKLSLSMENGDLVALVTGTDDETIKVYAGLTEADVNPAIAAWLGQTWMAIYNAGPRADDTFCAMCNGSVSKGHTGDCAAAGGNAELVRAPQAEVV